MIKKVTEKDKKRFNNASVHPLQSWEWGGFREKAGNKVVRLGVFDPSTRASTELSRTSSGRVEKLTDAIQVVFSKIPYTNFKIGTVIKGSKPTKETLQALKDLAKEENAIFIKLEPNFVIGTRQQALGTRKLLQDSGAVRGKTLFTPTSFWIDLTKSEEESMKSFSSKTRYNIRLAQKREVKVIEDNSDKAFEKYIELTRETVERQGFYAHTEKYHRLMWEYLHRLQITDHRSLASPTSSGQRQTSSIRRPKLSSEGGPIARLLVAKYKNQIITAWILFVWHDSLYYPYGASSDKYKNVMANNLMMWEAIRYGKKLGLKTFDLWGREEGKGFTKFKEGYNPQVVEFLGTWDLVTSPFYWPYRAAEAIRWTYLRGKTRLGFSKPKF